MLLTIADYVRPALTALAKLTAGSLVWVDCEALERRHNLGRGTLVVLDAVPEIDTPHRSSRRLVMKRVDSIYPVQRRSATEGFHGWCKRRFLP